MSENSLFTGFYSFEKPNLKGVEKLQKELSKCPDLKPKLTFHFPLDKERVEAINMIRTGKINEKKANAYKNSEDFVMWRAGEFFLRKAKELSKESKAKGEKIDSALKDSVNFGKNKHLWLLGSQKPLFATPHTKELTDALMDTQKLSQRLKERSGDKFIGIIVFGSAFKGYYKRPDIDSSIVLKEGAVDEIYQFLNDELTPRHVFEFHEHVEIGTDNEVISHFGESQKLFSGLFFGDYNKLVRLQKTLLEKQMKIIGIIFEKLL